MTKLEAHGPVRPRPEQSTIGYVPGARLELTVVVTPATLTEQAVGVPVSSRNACGGADDWSVGVAPDSQLPEIVTG